VPQRCGNGRSNHVLRGQTGADGLHTHVVRVRKAAPFV
jgi:hypothetical protein